MIDNKSILRNKICAECEYPLVERWNPQTSQREIKCGNDKSHVGFKPYSESKSEQERKGRQMVSDKNQTALAKYSGSVALDKAEAEEVLLSIWPDAPKTEVFKAALLCKQYGLNPLMKHLYLVGYNDTKTGEKTWSIQIGIGATRMIARRSGAYSYVDDTPRLMTDDEQKKIFGEVDKVKFWAITKLVSKDGMTAQAYGNWEKSKFVKGADKGNTPQNMAFIRSERAALDKLFPEKLPAGIDVFASEYQDVQVVNPATGEITGGKEAKRIETASPAVKPTDTTTKQPEATPEGKQGQTNPMTAIATEAQWTRIGELGHKTGHSTKSVCEYVGKKTDEWRTVTVAQAGDIINWLSGLKPVQSEKDMKLPFEGE